MSRRTRRLKKRKTRRGGFRLDKYIYQLRTNIVPASAKKTKNLANLLVASTGKATRKK